MAVLGVQDLADIRVNYSNTEFVGIGCPYSKTAINAAAQAIEDILESAAFKTQLSTAIDTAIAPATMTAAQKRALAKWVFRNRFGRNNP